ncbi:MAG: tetratricopeptide repeat-containing sulfotransferase family protein [Rhizomicrobium sp.]
MPPQSPDPTGTLASALTRASQLLGSQPAKAIEQAQEILKVVPRQPQAALILGSAQRRVGDLVAARETLEALSASQPKVAQVWLELGLVLAVQGQSAKAIATLSRATKLNPDSSDAWQALAEQYALAGDEVAANAATAQQIRRATKEPALIEAATALCDNKLAIAERQLKDFLKSNPTNVAAIRMLAEVAARLRRYGDSEILLARCLALAPGFTVARHNYATVLHRQNKSEEAIEQVDILLRSEPGNPGYRALKGAALGQIGEYEKAIACYEDVLKAFPNQPKAWMSYGHALKAVGRQRDCIAAYKKSIALSPTLGEAYWSLANLKTFRFEPQNIEDMRALVARSELADEDRYHFHFSLGKALEDAGRYAEAFEHYAAGNALRRKSVSYDPDETTDHVRRSTALFTASFFTARKEFGNPAPDPIFIVGLPRAGSTLIEQILATHSAVEGTMELPDIIGIARRLSGRKARSETSRYPEILATLDSDAFYRLGTEYLEHTQIQRKLGRPHFIDKMPNNFAHVGLIHLILPNARIIDARRHPLGCCFSVFKQHFARGQAFSYDQVELGRYYADYVSLMSHFDTVLPGRVHRVFYEQMVEYPEREIRRLLDYCGLPFEEKCLRFYQNDRAVRTASSEQVRQPIFREGVDQWRHFEPWLGPLKSVLAGVLQDYPPGAVI